jgi:methionyl aminopeptidase
MGILSLTAPDWSGSWSRLLGAGRAGRLTASGESAPVAVRPRRNVRLKTRPDRIITLKSSREIALMRESGKVVAAIVDHLKRETRPGMTTADINRMAASLLKARGARSTAFGYFGFPGHICVSVNEQVVHGIPGPLEVRSGDLVKVDVAAVCDGFAADTAATYSVGPPSETVSRLMDVTEQALMQGIAQARPGNRIGDIGHAIQSYVEAHGMSVVREFVGHGVGRSMHEAPQVPHVGTPGTGRLLVPGMCLAIEPQVTLGSPAVRMLDDRWTAVTEDGSLSAHFEHTVAITEDGPQILTLL